MKKYQEISNGDEKRKTGMDKGGMEGKVFKKKKKVPQFM